MPREANRRRAPRVPPGVALAPTWASDGIDVDGAFTPASIQDDGGGRSKTATPGRYHRSGQKTRVGPLILLNILGRPLTIRAEARRTAAGTMADPFNPYAPPTTDGPPIVEPGERPRSRVPLVCGILSITFSGIFLLLLLIGMGSFALYQRGSRLPAAEAVPATRPAPAHSSPPLSDSAATVLGLGIMLLTPALLVIGIGQVRYKRWTLVGTRVWAVLAILSLAAAVLLSSAAATDRIAQVAQALPLIIGLAPYPIVLLALYSRRRVRSALR